MLFFHYLALLFSLSSLIFKWVIILKDPKSILRSSEGEDGWTAGLPGFLCGGFFLFLTSQWVIIKLKDL